MTVKLHFDDLTKITCPIGLLDDATFIRLTEHSINHGCQRWSSNGWVTIRSPLLYSDAVYRAAPRTMPVYPWAAMHERIKWCAVDANGEAYGYEYTPDNINSIWRASGEHFRIDRVFAGYKPGTVDWQDSLQARPEE